MISIEVPEWATIFIRIHNITKKGSDNYLFCGDAHGKEKVVFIGKEGTNVAEFSHKENNIMYFTMREKTKEEKNDEIARLYGKNNVHYVKPAVIKIL